VPLHIWGSCGVGESQIVSQAANDLDYDFLSVQAVQLDPVNLRGGRSINAEHCNGPLKTANCDRQRRRILP
jgi:MoxR-like ATPase